MKDHSVEKSILDLIGNTPIIKLEGENIWLKLEKFNPGGSIKDRPALALISQAEKDGKLHSKSIIVEPSSGNTGISLSFIGRAKGYQVIIVMPETMSMERKAIMSALGAKLILTSGSLGMKGALQKVQEMLKQDPNYFMPAQFDNEANVSSHYHGTATEIIRDMSDLDIFVAGVGTGGTFTGVSRRLKEHNQDMLTYAVEPSTSAVLLGGTAGPHKIQGIGAGFIPSIYDPTLANGVIQISSEEAESTTIEISRKINTLVGISTGANVAAARQLSKQFKDKKILTISPDGGEKYLSIIPYQ